MATNSTALGKKRIALFRKRNHDTYYQWSLVCALSLLCFVTVVPFAWVVVTSFKPNREIYNLSQTIIPQTFTLEHYGKVIGKGEQLPSYIFNTLIYALVTIAVVTLFGAMAGYALGMLRFKGADIIVNLILLLLSVPWVILLVPLLLFSFRLDMWNTRHGLILPYIALFLPVAIWIMRGAFMGMPKELGESARIEGASEFRVFWNIYLPMAKAGAATVVLLTFIDVWNEVLLAATLATTPEVANINIGLRILADEGQSFAFGTLSAVIILAMIPTLIVFVILQRITCEASAKALWQDFNRGYTHFQGGEYASDNA